MVNKYTCHSGLPHMLNLHATVRRPADGKVFNKNPSQKTCQRQLSHCLLSGEKRGDFNQQFYLHRIFVALIFMQQQWCFLKPDS
jgi:hypothetical protein